MTRSRQLVCILVATFPVVAVLDIFSYDPSEPLPPTTIPHGLVLGALCFFWCKAHARERGQTPPSGSALLSGLVAPIGVPLYLIRAKGVKAGLYSSGKALLVGVGCAAVYYVAQVVTIYLRNL